MGPHQPVPLLSRDVKTGRVPLADTDGQGLWDPLRKRRSPKFPLLQTRVSLVDLDCSLAPSSSLYPFCWCRVAAADDLHCHRLILPVSKFSTVTFMAVLYGVAWFVFSKFFLPVKGILFNTAQQFPTLTPYQSVSELILGISDGENFTRGIDVNSAERSDGVEDGLRKGQWWQQVTSSPGWGIPGSRQCCQTWEDAHSSHCCRLGATPLQNPLFAAAAPEGCARHSWLAVAGLCCWACGRRENSCHQLASARPGKPEVTHGCQKQNF